MSATPAVTPIDPVALQCLLAGYGLTVEQVAADASIPGTYWGEPEAGLRGSVLYVRRDTPLHSALHESAHYICMDAARRRALDRDAGGEDAEENAVCYLQLLLADQLPDVGRARLSADMDAWGYSFRLGSTQRWFEEDAADARAWLIAHALIRADGGPSGRVRP